jgi:hypothetical protein
MVELAATGGNFSLVKKLDKLKITDVYLYATINRKFQGGLNNGPYR